MTSSQPSTGPAATGRRPGLAATVGLYTLARLGLIAVVTALLLVAGVPFVIAVLVALVLALPLSMVLFRGLRGRLDAALADARERRSQEREALRARLRGDADEQDVPGQAPAGTSDEPAERKPDPGQD
jgi:hypothetical protein